MTLTSCPDCHGAGELVIRTHRATHDEPASEDTRECAECRGAGVVEVDPLEGADAGPYVEPDAVPVSFVEAAMLAAELGPVDEATLLDAVRVLRSRAA